MTIAKKFADRIDMTFGYVPASATDVSKTFAAARKRIAEQKAAEEAAAAERQVKVTRLKREGR